MKAVEFYFITNIILLDGSTCYITLLVDNNLHKKGQSNLLNHFTCPT